MVSQGFLSGKQTNVEEGMTTLLSNLDSRGFEEVELNIVKWDRGV